MSVDIAFPVGKAKLIANVGIYRESQVTLQ